MKHILAYVSGPHDFAGCSALDAQSRKRRGNQLLFDFVKIDPHAVPILSLSERTYDKSTQSHISSLCDKGAEMFQVHLIGDPHPNTRKITYCCYRIELPDGRFVNIRKAHLVQSRTTQIGVVTGIEKRFAQVLSKWNWRSVRVTWDHISDLPVDGRAVNATTYHTTVNVLIDGGAIH